MSFRARVAVLGLKLEAAGLTKLPVCPACKLERQPTDFPPGARVCKWCPDPGALLDPRD